MRQIKNLWGKVSRHTYLIYGLIIVLFFVLLLSRLTPLSQVFYNLVYNQPAFMSAWYIHALIFIVGIIGISLYIYIDYKQHVIPLRREMPTIIYTPGHYAKVVLIPKIRYQKNLIIKRISLAFGGQVLVVGLMTVIALNLVYAAPGSLTLTINQKSGTADPNPSYTSVFTVQFSEAIDKSTFTSSDITLGGTASGQQVQSITEAGNFDKTTYEVRIQATSVGSITPSIGQELITAQNGSSGTNQASTSSDNTVVYDGTYEPDEFIIKIKTDNPGSNGNNQFAISSVALPGNNFDIDCDNDGTPEYTNQGSVLVNCTYGSPGEYIVSLSGPIAGIHTASAGGQKKVLEVIQWGTNQWSAVSQMFYSQADTPSSFQITALDAPDLSNVESMNSMFAGVGVANNFNSNINHWDVSNIKYMDGVFSNNRSFNQPLRSWDVSNLEDASSMFYGAYAFNQSLNDWNTASLVDTESMFLGATSFNKPLSNWDMSSVTDMGDMFRNAYAFNQPLNEWDTSSVTDMSQMFYIAQSFNQPLDDWNVSNVTDMTNIFSSTSLSVFNYETTLVSWSQKSLQNNVTFGASSTTYCDAETQRQYIITVFNWTISDSGKSCTPPVATTLEATDITQTSAVIKGTTTSKDLAERGFQYGETFGYGQIEKDLSTANYAFQFKVGSIGIADGELLYPYKANFDSEGNIFVADFYNHRIQKFDSEGNFITKWGSEGAGDGQFNYPLGIVIDKNGYIYVTDTYNHRVQKFDSEGNFITKWGSEGAGDGQFGHPGGIVITKDGYIYVSDQDNNRIQKFDKNGNFISKFGSAGFGNGQFYNPNGLAIDENNYLYVADTSNNRVQQFDTAGNYVRKFGTPGYGNGQFNLVDDVAVDKDGNVYITDRYNYRIQKFDSAGSYLTKWGSFGVGDNQFEEPRGISIDRHGNIFVADYGGDRILVFRQSITAQLNDLTCGTTYYFRAYSTNINALSGFGEQNQFTTEDCPDDSDAFITTWKTDNPGNSASDTIVIPTNSSEIYDYNVDWGDGSTSSNQTGDATHTYDMAGTYTVKITGTFPRIYFGNAGADDEKILTVEQWGTNQWSSMQYAFSGCVNLNINATDAPDLSNVTDMSWMFSGATSLNSDISHWDISNVTNIERVFGNATSFNQPLNNWDTSNVTDMSGVFYDARSFNQPLDNWVTDNVVEMDQMFMQAESFNQSLNNWNVSSVVSMSWMFGWEKLEGSVPFNQSLSNWNVSSVVDMSSMFVGSSFNQPLSSWNVSSVVDMSAMFMGAANFNQDIGNWNTSAVATTEGMFFMSASFNQSLAGWDLSNLVNMERMFGNYDSLLDSLLDGVPFEDWPAEIQALYGLPNSGLSTAKYDDTLSSWSNKSLNSSVIFDAGTSTYCDAEAERQNIIDNFSWTINDSGESENCGEETVTATDFKITKTLLTPAPITAGQSVTYRLTITNEGPNDSIYVGYVYDVLPEEISLENSSGDNSMCIDGGPANEMDEVYWGEHYGSRHLIYCLPNIMDINDAVPVLIGESINIDINATALADFVDDETINKSMYLDSINEIDFVLEMDNFYNNNLDIFTINSNNVSNHVYKLSNDSNNPDDNDPGNNDPDSQDPETKPTDNPNDHNPAQNTPSNPNTNETPSAPGRGSSSQDNPNQNIDESSTPINNPGNKTLPDELDRVKASKVSLIDKINKQVRRIPKSVATGAIFSVWLILAALAALHGYIAWKEYKKHIAFNAATGRFKRALEANSRFIRLASHYLRTPIAKIQGALELMKLDSNSSTIEQLSSNEQNANVVNSDSSNPNFASGNIDPVVLGSANMLVNSLSKHAEDMLSENEVLKNNQSAVTSSLNQVTIPSVIGRPEFLVPVSAILVLTALLHILFIQADRYDTTLLGIAFNTVLGLVAIVSLGTALFFKNQMQRIRQADSYQIRADQEIENNKQAFITNIYSDISIDTDELSKLQIELSGQKHANIFSTGLSELKYVVSKVKSFVELSKFVPGVSWKTDLAPVLSAIIIDKQPQAKAKNIELITESIPVIQLNIDKVKLEYILKAIITNAINASLENDRITLKIVELDKDIRVSVSDNGSGIPEDIKQSLLSPFTKTTDEEVFTGTGLGLDLALVKNILDQVGGDIEIKSGDKGVGTTVELVIPKS